MNVVGDLVIVDTTVFLNLLNVPEFNDDRDAVFREFEQFVKTDARLLLPLTTILETGGHITEVKTGGNRRRYAEVLREEVGKALRGEAPWLFVSPPGNTQLEEWLDGFPDCAMRGLSLCDVSLIALWKSTCQKRLATRVLIWSLDENLKAYDRKL